MSHCVTDKRAVCILRRLCKFRRNFGIVHDLRRCHCNRSVCCCWPLNLFCHPHAYTGKYFLCDYIFENAAIVWDSCVSARFVYFIDINSGDLELGCCMVTCILNVGGVKIKCPARFIQTEGMVQEGIKTRFVRFFLSGTTPVNNGRSCSWCAVIWSTPADAGLMQCRAAGNTISQPHSRCSGCTHGIVIAQCSSPQCHKCQCWKFLWKP